MKNFWTIFLVLIIIGCSNNNINKGFEENIKGFNEFYANDKGKQDHVIVYPSGKNNNSEIRRCFKATVKTNNISLKNLSIVLSKLYNANISYSSNLAAAHQVEKEKMEKDVKSYDQLLKEQKKKAEEKTKKKRKSKDDIANGIFLNMQNVCLDEIFDSLIENYDIGVKKFPYGYTIYPRQVRTETFSVDYHNFVRQGKSAISIVNSQLKENQVNDNFSSITTESSDQFWSSISKTIRSILSSDKERTLVASQSSENALEDFYVYKESGLIVVTAYPKQLKYIKNFLDKVNQNSATQVLIEAKVLEVELRNEFSNGIQWDLLQKKLYYSSFGLLNSAIDSTENVHKVFNLSTEDDLPSNPISVISPNRNDFNVVMQAIAAQGKISVISSPRVSALNNQRALIKSGEDRFFVTNVTNLTFANATAENSQSQSGFNLEPFFSGVALDTTPHIINKNEILLHIHPMISRVNDENKPITIDNKDTRIPIAKIQSREADTVVKAKSGDIIILGGMTEDYINLRNSKLPLKTNGVLEKISNLMTAKKEVSRKVELIILIKPTIIGNFENYDDIGSFKISR